MLEETVASLEPGYFAIVMATGILSTAALTLGLPWLSLPLLGIAAAAYLVLCALTAWRVIRFPARILGDATSPGRAFTLLTFVAASSVLGTRLAASGQTAVAEVLAVVAAAGWLLLTYAIPARLIAARPKEPLASAVNGTWLIWVVGTQSVAVALATLAPVHPGQMAGVAFASVV
ncbi:MAG: tellurite resistance protein permease, partial [Candidatus Dormiibacterota bacterium]